MVWLPAGGVLFGGCAVRPADATTLGNTAHADLKAWTGAIQRALERYGNAEVVVPGHGAKGGPELLRHTLSLLRR
jgi:metallo-beta-lactamase class B